MKAAYISLGAGAMLVVFSFLLPMLVGGKRAWSEEDRRAYEAAGDRVHAAIHAEVDPGGHEHHGAEGEAPAVSLDTAKEEYEQQKAKLEAAQNRGRFTGNITFVLGLLCSGAGVVMYYVNKDG